MSKAQAGERTWIEMAADQFESDWKRGGDRPRIEDLLAQEAGPRRALLLKELLRVECELREVAGEKPRSYEYRQRFPDDRAAVDAVLGLEVTVDPPAMPRVGAAPSLLFGILALHNNFIDRETLLAAFNTWVADKSRSLGQILLDRGALTAARHALLEGLAQEHLRLHGFDSERSLAEVTVTLSVRDSLEEIPDFELRDSLINLCLANDAGAKTEEEGSTESEGTTNWIEESAATDAEGRFRIVRFHDRGALGEVFVARDQQLHRMVALKRIRPNQAADPDKRARFVVEAEITGRLEHPGIVPVYGLGTYDDGRPFYAMRFIRGDNLKTAIEQFHKAGVKGRDPGERNLALLKLLRRFLDVCNAIDYAHSRGVLHRDLKPGNIMLGKFGETLVVDWGLAKSVGRPDRTPDSTTMGDRTLVPQSGSDLRATMMGTRMGTPAYMSPEQAAGRIADLGPASDVYSLGATLYCVLTGSPPFQDADLSELLRKVEVGDFQPPRKVMGWIDPALEAVCMKAMAKKPDDRYRTPRALADDIEHWLADEPVSAWREPLRRRLRRWGRRNRLLVTGLGATLIVAVASLGIGNVLVARQRDIAERNLAFARTVVDEMYTRVADNLDDQEQMDDYQREILEKALKFYDRFALPQSGDSRVRQEAGLLGIRVGKIRHRLGQGVAAQASYRQAIAILSGLAADYPAEPGYRHALAQAEFGLMNFFRGNDLWDDCIAEAKKAIEIWEALVRERPDVAEYRQWLAETRSLLAFAYRRLGRLDETDREYRAALGLAEQLAKERPDSIAARYLLGKLLENSTDFRLDQGKVEGIDETLSRTFSIFQSLERQDPKAKKYRADLGDCYRFLGNAHLNDSSFAKSQDAYERGLAIFKGLLAEHPQCLHCQTNLANMFSSIEYLSLLKGDLPAAADYASRAIEMFRSLAHPELGRRSARGDLILCLTNRAEVVTHLGRYAEAVDDYEEALKLRGDLPSKDTYNSPRLMELLHALSKARLGDDSSLARLSDEQIRVTLKEKSGVQAGSWMSHFDAACVQAALARSELKDRRIPPADRPRLAERDLDRALDSLDQARATGEFKGMIRLDEVRRDPTLDPLRAHPRFRLLMMDLEFPANPFGP